MDAVGRPLLDLERADIAGDDQYGHTALGECGLRCKRCQAARFTGI
jgi:hypothetical protein